MDLLRVLGKDLHTQVICHGAIVIGVIMPYDKTPTARSRSTYRGRGTLQHTTASGWLNSTPPTGSAVQIAAETHQPAAPERQPPPPRILTLRDGIVSMSGKNLVPDAYAPRAYQQVTCLNIGAPSCEP